MDDFATIDQIKTLFSKAKYISLATIRDDGTPHPSNVRVAHGHSFSLYFLSEKNSEKSQNIQKDPRVSGSLLIDPPEPGEGVNLYFNGIAHVVSASETTPSLMPSSYNEREKMISALCKGRSDYAGSIKEILLEQTDIRLHRILLTKAWYNGGIYRGDLSVESNATRNIIIVGDRSCPLVRRYMVDGSQPTPDYAVRLPDDVIAKSLGLSFYS